MLLYCNITVSLKLYGSDYGVFVSIKYNACSKIKIILYQMNNFPFYSLFWGEGKWAKLTPTLTHKVAITVEREMLKDVNNKPVQVEKWLKLLQRNSMIFLDMDGVDSLVLCGILEILYWQVGYFPLSYFIISHVESFIFLVSFLYFSVL